MYHEYYGYMLRLSVWDPLHKAIMWEKMVTVLQSGVENHWQGPLTLSDCGNANCTHQCHQEGKWRPVLRGTGCRASEDELLQARCVQGQSALEHGVESGAGHPSHICQALAGLT